MFQYALGRRLSIRYNAELMGDVCVLDFCQHKVARNYALDVFSLELKIATRKDVAQYHPHGARKIQKVYFHIRNRFRPREVLQEKQFGYDSDIVHATPPLYLSGTWQSYRYFSAIETTLRKDFEFRQPLPPVTTAIAEQMDEEVSVCLHVRRGDYIDISSNAMAIGFVGIDYYLHAVEYIKTRVNRPMFFVFSDDITWCEENLSWLGNDTVFVRYELPIGIREYSVDLQLMKRARHFIIANSTFSWWAAWLAGRRAKTVIAPKNWFRAQHLSSSELIPPHWIRI